MLRLDPGKQLVGLTVEFNVCKAQVAEHVAADAHMHLMLFVVASSRHVKEFLEVTFAGWKWGGCKDELFVTVWGAED